MAKLAGKVALVTGAGRGIGRGISLAFAREGASVVLASRSEAPLREAARLVEETGARAYAIVCDVGEPAEVERMVADAASAFGRLDVLVNNAQSWGAPAARSVTTPLVAPEELPLEWFDHTFRTGVRATFSCCRAAFPHLRERGGKIINFGSAAGILGVAGMSDYAANKEAIRGLSRSLARSWGRYGINVNVICPSVETDSLAEMRKTDPALIETALRARSIQRFGDAERDAGALAVFLASADSDYITGGTFMLDGGNTMF
jgi:NAD(P)-dependent dehydrogenase (short-subunit alcohol dehydrogenase family)